MIIKTESNCYDIMLNLFHGYWDGRLDPDCFDDLERDFPNTHPCGELRSKSLPLPGFPAHTYCVFATEAEYNDLVDYWWRECDSANAGKDGGRLAPISAEYESEAAALEALKSYRASVGYFQDSCGGRWISIRSYWVAEVGYWLDDNGECDYSDEEYHDPTDLVPFDDGESLYLYWPDAYYRWDGNAWVEDPDDEDDPDDE